jgi:putative ABC transport system permease protein
VKALDRKLLRDLWKIRGQVFTIALVVACGIGAYISMRSTWSSLERSRDTFYDRGRFGDVFISLERAPLSMVPTIEAIDGVAIAYARVVEDISVPIEGLDEPATGRIISVPGDAPAPLNDVYLLEGRLPDPGIADEIVLIETFARAHELHPGDTLPAIVNGAHRQLRIVGLGMSPDYVMAVLPGDMTVDAKRFAVMWMDERVLSPAFQMEGAFSDLSLRLQPNADPDAVLMAVDEMLEPYGGRDAVTREKQLSNFILDGEMAGLETMATVVPFIFLAVAAFLLNVVLGRLVTLQRQQIATLEALGYSKWRVSFHYLELVSAIVVIGALLGVAVGMWLGGALTDLYAQYFHFPTLEYHMPISLVVVGVGVSLLAAVTGVYGAVRRISKMPPAQAMRAPAPARYSKSPIEVLGLNKLFGQSMTMVFREVWRRPWRTFLSALGIAAAIGICIVGRFFYDSFDYLVNDLFHRENRGDTSVYFVKPLDENDIRSLEHTPGVLDAEGHRVVPVRLRVGHRWRDSAITGLPDDHELRQLIDRDSNEFELPDDGIVMTDMLADILDVDVGDEVLVEIRENERRVRPVTVAMLVDEPFGLNAYMRLSILYELLGEMPRVSVVHLRTDPTMRDEVGRRLKEMPGAWRVVRKQTLLDNFEAQTGGSMMWMTLILTVFAGIIAIGVVYNNARVALSMRSRDLSSLRVLGFTRREISAVLLGELALQVAVAIPLGLYLGHWWSTALAGTNDPEMYRLPIIISDATYAYAIAVTAIAALISAMLVRRKLDHLDLIAVLKTRE